MVYLHPTKIKTGVQVPPINATRFAGIPFLFISKFGSKGSNSGTEKRSRVWGKKYDRKNSIRQNRASRQG